MSVLDTNTFNSPIGFIKQDFNVSPFNYSSEICYGQAIALQPDGKIVMTGKVLNNDPINPLFEIGLVRYLPNGTLDTSFGSNGLTSALLNDLLNVPCSVDVNGITLQSDGKIVVCGNLFNSSNFYDLYVARFLSNGNLDPSFGGGLGYVVTTSGSFSPSIFDNCYANSIQIDNISGIDKIVICGNIRVSSTGNYRLCMARYNIINGNLDPSFGTGGLVQENFGTPLIDKFGSSLAVSNSGEYFISGFQQTNVSPPNNKFIIAKFTNLGSVVGSFGTSGLAIIPNFFPGSSDGASSVLIQQDGQVVAAGTSIQQPNGEECFALCRVSPINGSLDNLFGSGGKVVTNLSSQAIPIYLNGYSIKQQIDGKLILGGYFKYPTTINQEQSFALARYNANGSLDTSFGINGNGLILEDLTIGTIKEQGYSLIIQPNGQILLAGIMGEFSDISDKKYFVLARYFYTPVPPVPPVPVPIVPICFPAGTPVFTDQGYIPIEEIDPEINTIRNKTIVAVTKTITNHDKIVCFEKHSLGYNVPNKKTFVSLNHGIIYNKKIIPAKKFVGRKHGVYFKKYNGEYLYNVLMEKHSIMVVNGMKVETLNPKNMVAKLYTNKYSEEQKTKIILSINNYSQSHNNKYNNFNNYERLQFNKTRKYYEVHKSNPILGRLHMKTQKNYSFLNNIIKEIPNQTVRNRIPFIKNNSNVHINKHILHRFTRYGRRRR